MMAAMIELSPQHRWTATNWLFEWAMRHIAVAVDDDALRASIAEIVRENLGTFALSDYAPPVQTAILDYLRHQIEPAAADQLPLSGYDRPQALSLIADLSDQARRLAAPLIDADITWLADQVRRRLDAGPVGLFEFQELLRAHGRDVSGVAQAALERILVDASLRLGEWSQSGEFIGEVSAAEIPAISWRIADGGRFVAVDRRSSG